MASAGGWHADLRLGLARRGAQTLLMRNQHQGPLQVQKVLYPEGAAVAHVALLHPPGGIAAGDRLCAAVDLGERSQALLTTPGAAKWYRSEGAWASQQLEFALAEHATLEWLPRESIFFDSAQISMHVKVQLAAGARYLGWDIFSFGRRASGESWRSGKLRLRTEIHGPDGMLWSELANLDAGGGFAQSAVGLAGYSVCGNFVCAGVDLGAALLADCRALAKPASCRIGITRLPRVLVARYLGHCTEQAFLWFADIWQLMRPAAVGRPAHRPRLWAC